MIIPFPKNFFSFMTYPLTLVILVLNLMVFLILSDTPSQNFRNKILNENDLILAGRLYSQYLNMDSENLMNLGIKAVQDNKFISFALTHSFYGDQVQIDKWKKNIIEFSKNQNESNFNIFGLSRNHQTPIHWVTYQFVHSGLPHLFFNMLFFVLMGSAIEPLVGSMGLILVYIVGGVFGGLFYLILNQQGIMPVVGASASLSALISFYLFMEPRHRIRYLYFISPASEHYGVIYLPKFLIFPLFMLSDITHVLTMGTGFTSSVAHTAHLGGFFAGALLASIEKSLDFFDRSKSSSHGVFSDTNRL